MELLLVILVLLGLAGATGTVASIRSDGYGPRPARGDRFVPPSRWI